jgi:uncharacterized protein (TIGR02594 family)
MRYQLPTLVALACASVIAASAPTLALPSKPAATKTQRVSPTPLLEQSRRPPTARVSPRLRPKAANRAWPAPRTAARHRLVARPVSSSPARPVFGWPTLVSEARKYIGTNPTARTRLWCATFMNFVLAKTGYSGTGSDAARSFVSYGKRVFHPRTGAIAVLTRGRNGGHVGIVTGIDKAGNPVIISGNHGRLVGEATYPRSRVIAYVMPVERTGATQIASALPARARARVAPPPQQGVEFPITELLAAINAEQPPARARMHPSQRQWLAQRADQRRQAIARAQAEPQRGRLVQQTPETPRGSTQTASNNVTVKKALSELFGVSAAHAEPAR